jgi:hypothetical protein
MNPHIAQKAPYAVEVTAGQWYLRLKRMRPSICVVVSIVPMERFVTVVITSSKKSR